jgi:hypothetical protein
MNKYKIKYNYNSGDSFNSYSGLQDFLEIYWENLENAKSNLKRIKEHYEQCEQPTHAIGDVVSFHASRTGYCLTF